MTLEESNGHDGRGDNGGQPNSRVIDKPRVLAHLRQQLEELAEEAEADHGDA